MSHDKILYHYCSNDTLVKIIENKTVRLSSLDVANDSNEGTYITDLLRRLYSNQNWSERDAPPFYNALRQAISNQVAHIFDKKIEQTIGLAFCMSEAPDLLSQWSRYGAGAEGVSIGFSKTALDSLVDKLVEGSFMPMTLLPIEYSEEAQLEFLKGNAQVYSSRDTDQVLRVFHSLWGKMFAFKDNAFSEEKEWRLLAIGMLSNQFDKGWNKLQLRSRNDSLSFCFDYKLGSYSDDLIKEVWLGPKNNTNIAFFQYWLESKGMKSVKVRPSSITLR